METSICIEGKRIQEFAHWLAGASQNLLREWWYTHCRLRGMPQAMQEIFMDDIGRHNAVDKAIGCALLAKRGIREMVLVSSGRVSSEILQKARLAQIAIVIARADRPINRFFAPGTWASVWYATREELGLRCIRIRSG